MGDISIKGRSPLLTKTLLDKTLKNFRILNRGRKEKNVEFGPLSISEREKKQEPQPQLPTKKQR